MAQEGFDILMALTDSRYRLSMITARRAAQLKLGIPSTLTNKRVPRNINAVSVAMKELELNTGVGWGADLPSTAEIQTFAEQIREEEPENYSITRKELQEMQKSKSY